MGLDGLWCSARLREKGKELGKVAVALPVVSGGSPNDDSDVFTSQSRDQSVSSVDMCRYLFTAFLA